MAAESGRPARSTSNEPGAYPADRKTFPIDKWNLASQRLRNHCSITTIFLMPTYVLPETVSSKTRHGFVILTGSENAAQARARADRVRELIKVEVAAGAPAGEVVAR